MSLAACAASTTLPLSVLAQGSPSSQVRFGYDDVVRRARDLSGLPFETSPLPLPEPLGRLSFDEYRDIRFRSDKAFLGQAGASYRMQMFHLGFLFTRPVTVNIVRDGVPTPVPYAQNLFDFGRNRFDKSWPVNLGFAGFRLHYPLNDPKMFDELISFVGSSYFRVLGRNQHYGLSARGLSIGAGDQQEEFPFFREFWVEPPQPHADRVVIHALLDSASVTGAFQFIVYPSRETVTDVTATLFPRRMLTRLGIAPLTSMFFTGENDRRFFDDFRTELHDSDGLLIHSGSGEWIWRPLRNPRQPVISAFMDKNVRGFGLMQRDRTFEHYQDLDLHYELRPSYWIEPDGDWGEGHVELVELPTSDETNDNIVAVWIPKQPAEPGQSLVFRYTLTSTIDERALHPGGFALNTYQAKPKALGSGEVLEPGARRFIIDFAGGDLDFYAQEPERVELVPSISNGRITRTFLLPNPKTKGFRAGIDVSVPLGQSADIRAFLKYGSKALTETWTFPWSPPVQV